MAGLQRSAVSFRRQGSLLLRPCVGRQRIPVLAIRVFNAVISLVNSPKMNSLAIRKVLEVMNDIETAVSEMKKRDNEEASRSNSDGKEEASGEEYSPEEERTATEGA
ncbi:hypothetical protein CRG98_041517 [Punica granatum]|uniref:Uncharacterized protein n=1 Tax=Punica granatum TaxID=22663 RepID=A0A2I0I2A5_PUNGR|nr:hypothetical protein CRG98_041517 [Punica granatum]